MLESVDVGERAPDSYGAAVDGDIIEQRRGLAGGLRGLRVLHVNATPYGGGVSELLRSAVPLLSLPRLRTATCHSRRKPLRRIPPARGPAAKDVAMLSDAM